MPNKYNYHQDPSGFRTCCRCGKLKFNSDFRSSSGECKDCWKIINHNYRASHKQKVLDYSRSYRAKEKLEVLRHYSGCLVIPSCIKCGFSDIRALSIDHILGGGTAYREDYAKGSHFYTWLRKNNYPEGYQVLCMNCQFIKRHENKEWANV